MDTRKLLCENEEDSEHVANIFEEIRCEFSSNSDRGVTVIAASIIDSLMEELLESFLVTFESKSDRKNIFSSNGPLSNLSNKIEMAFSLGLISIFDKKLLKTIVLIRNKFAHRISGISFKNKEIIESCKQLVITDNLIVSMDIGYKIDNIPIIYKPKKDDFRGWFQAATYLAITILTSRKIQNISEKRLTPDNFKHRADFYTININSEKNIIEIAKDTILNKEHYKLTDDQLKRIEFLLNCSKQRLAFFEIQKQESFDAKIIEQ
ncbi:hypothetical protein ACGJWK_001804 [Klebsiella aerogenes]|nr:hypothetical protein [Salmonella enterica]EKW1127944.1 hypothetical protein [Klebsiella aerogenes]EKW1132190.1 hypothetical protein [Klebsiella aerogenes]ELN6910130.1 hypothetical protein [Salmonella enterica]